MRAAIQKRVAEIHGEDPSSSVMRCPGASCSRWESAAGATYEEKVREIRTCSTCGGNPPLEETEEVLEADPGEIDRLVAIVEDLVAEYDAGAELNLEDLEPWEWTGIVTWGQFSGLYSKIQNAKIVALLGGPKGR